MIVRDQVGVLKTVVSLRRAPESCIKTRLEIHVSELLHVVEFWAGDIRN
jgi:hypothetical protein